MSEQPVQHWEVRLLLASWADIDRALADVSRDDLVRQVNGGSSFAWTLAHVTHGIDSWINGRFQHMALHPLYADGRFLFGGDGTANDWEDIRDSVDEIRQQALPYLTDPAIDLELTVPYDGSMAAFREGGIGLRPAILQNAIHHTFHLGEIVSKREWMGYDTGSFPGSFVNNR